MERRGREGGVRHIEKDGGEERRGGRRGGGAAGRRDPRTGNRGEGERAVRNIAPRNKS